MLSLCEIYMMLILFRYNMEIKIAYYVACEQAYLRYLYKRYPLYLFFNINMPARGYLHMCVYFFLFFNKI